MKIQKLKMAGFTMIELLVVIAIIGILAVAVLSSINPIEQINKGRDTRLRSNAAQLINATDRFYAIQEIYPWNDDTFTGLLAGDTVPSLAVPTADAACPANATNAAFCKIGGPDYLAALPWLTALSETQEVKASFVDSLEETSSSNGLYIIKNASPVVVAGTDSDVHICFAPSSKQFQLEAVSGCASGTTPEPACPLGGPSNYSATTDWADEMICLP